MMWPASAIPDCKIGEANIPGRPGGWRVGTPASAPPVEPFFCPCANQFSWRYIHQNPGMEVLDKIVDRNKKPLDTLKINDKQ
jgi:hypothetical protein